jgi:hypothetical protein
LGSSSLTNSRMKIQYVRLENTLFALLMLFVIHWYLTSQINPPV